MQEAMSVSNITDLNDGRNRRKVMFRSDDMNFSDLDESDTQIDDNDNESNIEDNSSVNEGDNNDSDSQWSDSEEEIENQKDKINKSRFYGQSFDKESEIRKKISNELAKLDKINQQSNISNWNEQEQDFSDFSIEYDEDSDIEDESENNFKVNECDNYLDEVNDKNHNLSLTCNVPIDNIKEINEDTTLNWKTNLAHKATNAYYERQNSVTNLWKLVYGE